MAKLINILFFLYGAIIVLCDNAKYLIFIYIINIMLGVVFIIYKIISKDFRIIFNEFLKVYFLFILFSLMSTFWSLDFFYSLKRNLTLVLVFLNSLIIINLNYKFNNYYYIIYGILFGVFINFLWLLGIVDLNLTYEGWRFQGTVLQANNFAFILIFSLISLTYFLLQANTLKILLVIVFDVIILYMIFFIASKTGIFLSILLLTIQIMLFTTSKWMILFVLFVWILILNFNNILALLSQYTTLDIETTYNNLVDRLTLFLSGNTMSDWSTYERIYLIEEAFNLWSSNLFSVLFGNGIAAFEVLHGKYSHNNITELLSSVGVLGVSIYYFIYIYLFLLTLKIKNLKKRIIFIVLIMSFLLFDQTIVSYANKFKILAILLLYLMIENERGKGKMCQK